MKGFGLYVKLRMQIGNYLSSALYPICIYIVSECNAPEQWRPHTSQKYIIIFYHYKPDNCSHTHCERRIEFCAGHFSGVLCLIMRHVHSLPASIEAKHHFLYVLLHKAKRAYWSYIHIYSFISGRIYIYIYCCAICVSRKWNNWRDT